MNTFESRMVQMNPMECTRGTTSKCFGNQNQNEFNDPMLNNGHVKTNPHRLLTKASQRNMKYRYSK